MALFEKVFENVMTGIRTEANAQLAQVNMPKVETEVKVSSETFLWIGGIVAFIYLLFRNKKYTLR